MKMIKAENIPIISIIVPLYCEENNIEKVLLAIKQALIPINKNYEIIMIDDGSSDNTWVTIKKQKPNHPTLRAIRLSRNFGKEAAICAGIEMAKGQAVIIMDGDMQHPPHLIPKMINLWQKKQGDIIEAVKVNRGNESVFGKINAYLFYKIFRLLTGYDLQNASDFKLLDRRVVNAFFQMKERNLFFRGMSAWLGFKRVQVPFEVEDRSHGQSGWSLFKLFRLAFAALTAFSSKPLHLITMSGLAFAIFAVLLTIQTIYLKLMGSAEAGFSTVILLLLIIGSILMFGLGIIGEYLAKIYEEVKGRPRYIIDEDILE